MSQPGSGFCEWLENSLAALVSLRFFRIRLLGFDIHSENDALRFITKSCSRAHKLEYFVIFDSEYYYWRRLRGEWVVCDEADCA
jgi:hypothetical protein